MDREIRQIALVAATLFLLACDGWAANLVVNGDFEGATAVDAATGDLLPTSWTNGPPSPVTLSKVNVDTAVDSTVDLGPENGTHYVRYQSPATNGTADCLLQDLATIAGQKYAISFWIAATATSAGNPSGINPVWDENRANQASMAVGQLFAPATNTGPLPYQHYSFVETASGSVTRLDFHATDVGGSILLDNVAVIPEVTGDYNSDGQVDSSDYLTWSGMFGSTSSLAADGNGNGIVDAADYIVWRDHLAPATGSSSATAAPEPATILLCGVAGVMVRSWIARRKLQSSIVMRSMSCFPLPRGIAASHLCP